MILLDSHALTWFLLGDRKLGQSARRRIEAAAGRLSVSISTLTYYELGVAIGRGTIKGLSSAESIKDIMASHCVIEIAPDAAISIRASHITHSLGDGFDALITATAIERGLHLVTADERILGWKGPLRRLDARR